MQTNSDTPQTDAVEGDLLAEYRYCEASFNGMAEHARDLERALQTIASQSLRKDWSAEQELAFVKQHARAELAK